MNRWSFILLLGATCWASDSTPKFHYKDCVRVVSGFYQGCKGRVDSFSIDDTTVKYEVNLRCKGYGTVTTMSQDELAKASGCEAD